MKLNQILIITVLTLLVGSIETKAGDKYDIQKQSVLQQNVEYQTTLKMLNTNRMAYEPLAKKVNLNESYIKYHTAMKSTNDLSGIKTQLESDKNKLQELYNLNRELNLKKRQIESSTRQMLYAIDNAKLKR